MTFVVYWGYDIQGAIYQKIVESNIKKQLPFFIAVGTKERITDLDIIGFPQKELDDVLSTVPPNINRIIALKAGEVEPDRCERCDYCKTTKVLTGPIHHSEILFDV